MKKRSAFVATILVWLVSTASAQDPDRGLVIGPAPEPQAGNQRWALIVGINDYTNVPTLRYARSDAEALANVLTEKCSFPKDNVVLMTDARDVRINDPGRYPTRGNLRARVNQIAQLAKANDLLLIGFSGHGIELEGRGYLIPVDGAPEDVGSLVPLSWVKETLESSPAMQRMLLLDACHAGGRSGDVTNTPAEALLSPLASAAFATLASCDSQQLSHEDPNIGRGVFTDAVIKGLEGKADIEAEGNRDATVTDSELFAFASLKVKQWSLKAGKFQTPVLRGEFKGRIELARFKTIEELKSQREQLQGRLKAMEDMQRTSAAEDLKKEIAELEAQLNAITGITVDGAAGSDEIQMAYARYDAAKKQVAEIEALLAETLKTYQPTSSAVAKVKERLAQAQTDLGRALEGKRQADQLMYQSLESQAKAKQAAYDDLTRELLPSAPQAQALEQQIGALRQRQMKLKLSLGSKPGEVITNSIGMKLVRIPADEFDMGSPISERERGNDEGPVHRVRISKDFWMAQMEVTQAQYRQVTGANPSLFKGDDLPVETVSWEEAVAFCRKLTDREGFPYGLPTEAQWEYACRAGTTTPFNTGQIISTDQANYDGDHTYGNGRKGIDPQKTREVGGLAPNAFGLYDMHGNVWEWCSDWYDEKYYAGSPGVDPSGPSGGATYRVLRGGSWNYNPGICRSANRDWITPNLRYSNVGFRIVLLDFQ